MTRAYRAEEAWYAEDGAPAGPSFDMEIPSSRKGRRPYRVSRDALTGTILHVPACEAWTYGRKLCRHLSEAHNRSWHPERTFFEVVDALLKSSTWWASPECAAKRDMAVIVRYRDEARAGREQIAEADRLASRAPVTEADVAEFFT
jgi:hypothetical protein